MGVPTLRVLIAVAFVAATVLPLGAATPPPPPNAAQDLGGLGGSPLAVYFRSVSKNGTVAGSAQKPSAFTVPILWTAQDGLQVIGTQYGYTAAANNWGQATGVLTPLDDNASAFFYAGPNSILTIQASQAWSITPQVINDAGQVAGYADLLIGEQHAFLWSLSGGFKDLGWLGNSGITVTDITENGLIVGHATAADGEQHAFSSKNGGRIRDLGTLGGIWSYAVAANENGIITGYSRTADNNVHGFVYKNNRMTALVTESEESVAYGINASGQIVGTSLRFGLPTATVWSPAGVATERPDLEIGVAINDSGVVAGYGPTYPGNTQRAYLWKTSDNTLLDGGSEDDQRSQAIGVTDDGRLVASRFDWSSIDKVYVWSPTAGRTLVDGLPCVWSRGLYVNGTGKVAGISRTKEGYNRAFVWTPSTTGGAMTEVPAPAHAHSQPVGLTSTGAVAGTTFKSAPGGDYTQTSSFYWSGSGTSFSDLGVNQVVDVNESGQVLGYVYPTSAFVWKAGVFTPIPTIGMGQLVPADINNNGQVVGRFNIDPWTIHAFSWKPAQTPVDLGSLGGTYSEGVAVNDAGQIAGNSTLAGEAVTHAFRTKVGSALTDLGSLVAGGNSFASAMNKNGVVVGLDTHDGSVFHAFLYDTRIRDLGETFDPSARPAAVNDHKDVIGSRPTPPVFYQRAWVSVGGAPIQDLPGLPGSVQIARAFGLNANGVAVGDAFDADNQQHAVLWKTR